MQQSPTSPLSRRRPSKSLQKPLRNKSVILKLSVVFVLGLLLAGAKIVGGIYSQSLSLISNAAHNFADLLGFTIAIASVWYAGKPANKLHTYGFHRAGIIGAIASVVILWVLNGFLVYFGIERIQNLDKYDIDGKPMFIVACVGLVINLFMIWILYSANCLPRRRSNTDKGRQSKDHQAHEQEAKTEPLLYQDKKAIDGQYVDLESVDNGEESADFKQAEFEKRKSSLNRHDNLDGGVIHRQRLSQVMDTKSDSSTHQKVKLHEEEDRQNINVRATILHIIGDLLQNIGVIIVSCLVWAFPDKMKIADPILTFIFATAIFLCSIIIIRDGVAVLMERTPNGFSDSKFEDELKTISGVCEVHDLHIWSIGVGKISMSVHIFTDGPTGPVLKRVTEMTRSKGIYHSTVQVETTQDKKNHRFVDCKHNIH